MRIDLYKDLYNLEGQHWWHLAKREKVLYFIKKYSRIKTPKILDIGCGTGKNVEVYNILGVGYGIDKSSEAIKLDRKSVV